MTDIASTVSTALGILTPAISLLVWFINNSRRQTEQMLRAEINSVTRKLNDIAEEVEKISDKLSIIDARSVGVTVDVANIKRNIDDVKDELNEAKKQGDDRFKEHQKTLVQWINSELARVKSVKGG